MALTPEDVVNKRFQSTKFREGYDQDEVDDFLDEVVVELRRLNQENEELRQRLTATSAELERRSAAPAPAAPAPVAEPEPIAVAPAPVPAPAAGFQAQSGYGDPSLDPNNTNNLLQLARRLHEEHVREGVEKRDALIAEGHAAAARLVSEAENQQRAQLGSLDQERQSLERRIEELRTFEREYRHKLKSYIEGQLRELDSASALPAAPAPAAVSASPAPAAVAAQPAPAAVGQFTPSAPAAPAPAPEYPQPNPFPGFGGN